MPILARQSGEFGRQICDNTPRNFFTDVLS
jgi:hypothetical protein